MDQSVSRRLDIASRSSLFIYANTAVIIPVCLVAIKNELGLSLTQAGLLSLSGALIQFVILLLAIPIAGFQGKIRTLRWGIWLLAAGILAFTRVTGFIDAFIIVGVIALGQAVLEALLTPLVEDIHPDDDGTNQATLHTFWPLGIIVGTLVVGEALSRGLSWRTAFLVLGLLCALVGILYPRRSRAALPRSRADFSHVGEILSEPLFWIMAAGLFLSGGAEGGFTYWTATYIQIEFGGMPRLGGLGTALFSLGMASGRFLASRFSSRIGLKRILLIAVALAAITGCTLYFTRSLVVLCGQFALMGLFIAPFWPILQTYAVRRLGADPTMVMIFLSCFGILGFSGANFLMGLIGDSISLRAGFLVAPAMLTVFFIVLLLEGRVRRK